MLLLVWYDIGVHAYLCIGVEQYITMLCDPLTHTHP